MKSPLTKILKPNLRPHGNAPMSLFSDLESEFDRWSGGMPYQWLGEFDENEFSPRCDINETDKEYLIRFDIPGIDKENVIIELDNSILTVRGSRTRSEDEKKSGYVRSEVSFGSFRRSFGLPSKVDDSKVDAQYKNGVLTVKLEKKESSTAKQIRVH